MQDSRQLAVTNDRQPARRDPLVDDVLRVMAEARRRWSRDDYADETQDEAVAEAVIAFLRPNAA